MKNLLLKLTFSMLLSSLWVGCYDEGKLVEISIHGKEPHWVFHSEIFPVGELDRISPMGITLSSTIQIFDKRPDMIIDAEVLLHKNGRLLETLEYVDSLGYYPINDSPNYNDDYRIEVNKPGLPIAEANVVVPSGIEIDTVLITPFAFFDEEDYVFSEVEIRFKDDLNAINFYEVVVFVTSSFFQSSTDFWPEDFQENAGEALELLAFEKVITEEPYYTSITNLNSDYPKSLLFRDNSFNGQAYSLKVYFNPPGAVHIRGHVTNHRLRVYLRKVSEAYFQFKTSMIQQYNQRQEDILYGVGEPLNVSSNISNGYGLFGAYSYDSYLLSVDGFIAK